jgi:non-ribosomal peptide synthase protein (TIGR01720 family)
MLRIPPSGDRPVPFALEINAVIVETGDGARLHISAAWPDAFLEPDESGRLLALWERALRGLARHAEAAPAGGLTPSDLPLVELTQDDIDDFENDDFEHDDLDSDDFDDFENDTF